ncbi:unnamed protein product [Clonostachys byssicola]|uniref:Uncharacterized protein n=1 Tax=Clonostachys byssicola TaxID=160290 RepID=A0A9N9Y0H3_9HYPO|nr:unnamed protein product [Clonostachys byssicola]
MLNEGSDPDPINIYCSTPLSIAAQHNQAHLIKQFLDTGRVNVASQDFFGRTPLWYARRYGYAEVEQLLLEHIKERDYHDIQLSKDMQAGDSMNHI